ncbi:MAG: L7Ae/L30e/S12e/Gadd45 family ribosomal protein [Gemmatimonadota bacterium]
MAKAGGLLGLLGLGARGGKVIVGVEAVRQGLKAGRVHCVVVASDASPRAGDKVVRLAAAKGIPLVTGPEAATIGGRLGRPPVMVVGVRDPMLAAGMLRAIADAPVTEG